MRKLLFVNVLGLLFFLSFSLIGSAEANSYPTAKEVENMNNELEELVQEANEQLEKGETNVEVTSDNLTLVFKETKEKKSSSKNLNSTSNSVSTAAVTSSSTIGSKSYQAYVSNTTGFNFRHGVYGTFSWNSKGVLTAVTGDESLTGVAYSRSGSTSVVGRDGRIGIDAKIGRVTSKATFTPLKYVPFPFYTTIIVDVYGPGKNYRIITAKIAQ